MRKKVNFLLSTLVFATFLSQHNANAQNTSPYWSVAGNSTATSTSKLGTTNDINLRIVTNNIERMRILSANGNVGIGMISPTDRLHVNSAAGANAMRIQVNSLTKLLVHSGGGVAIGGNTAPPANGLYVVGNVGLGTATPGRKLHVVGTALFTGNLNISNGGLTATNTTGRGVEGTGTSYGLYGTATGFTGTGVFGKGMIGVHAVGNEYGLYSSGDRYGVYSNAQDYGVYATSPGYGVYGLSVEGIGVYGTSNGGSGVYGQSNTKGVYGNAVDDGTLNYGVYGIGYTGVYGSGIYGVYGVGKNGGDAVRGEATGAGTYGVYGRSASSHGVVGITGNTSAYAGYFGGNVYSTGTYQGSDRTLKQDIGDVTSAIDILNKLQPKSYNYRQDGKYKQMNLPVGKHYGFIAQDVEQILPGLVKETTFETRATLPNEKQANGTAVSNMPATEATEKMTFKALNYMELIPLVVKGIQEQELRLQQQERLIQNQQQQIDELKTLVSRLTGAPNTLTSAGGSLNQNSPNPVQGSTRIAYTLPNGTTSARLLLTDNAGKTIKSMQLTASGVIHINTATLSSGIYTYSLIVDGRITDSKKMTVTRN
jgi:hypothetical protein